MCFRESGAKVSGHHGILKTVALIVNYKSSGLTLQAVKSVLDSASLGPVKVVVVDNSEDGDEAEMLRQDLPPGVVLLVSPQNIGFGRACNLAYEQFDGDQILLLNPDARLLPDCLLRLQKTLLSSRKVAAVSPQIFWDDRLKFYLPPSIPPLLFEIQSLFDAWGPHSPISRSLSVIWRYYSIKVWCSKRPSRVNNLSGGHVLLKRDAVRKAGGLFDPRFFLYFEDTDLFIRLKKAGYSLVIEPRAHAVHYVDQCGQEDWRRKRCLMARSHEQLLEKHSNGLKSRIKKASDGLCSVWPMGRSEMFQPDFTAPFVLEVPSSLKKRWLFEVSPNQSLIPSAGWFGKGPLVDFTERQWSMLAPGQYFGRLGSPAGFGGCSRPVSWHIESDISER